MPTAEAIFKQQPSLWWITDRRELNTPVSRFLPPIAARRIWQSLIFIADTLRHSLRYLTRLDTRGFRRLESSGGIRSLERAGGW